MSFPICHFSYVRFIKWNNSMVRLLYIQTLLFNIHCRVKDGEWLKTIQCLVYVCVFVQFVNGFKPLVCNRLFESLPKLIFCLFFYVNKQRTVSDHYFKVNIPTNPCLLSRKQKIPSFTLTFFLCHSDYTFDLVLLNFSKKIVHLMRLSANFFYTF